MSARDVDRLAAAMGERATGLDVERRGPVPLAELLARPELLTPPPAIIPSLAYAGRVTLLSAREKAGKSTLIGQAVAALSAGVPFLEDALKPHTVLWYAIDEHLGDAARRFQRFGADGHRVYVSDERPRADHMRADVLAIGAHLVVVDTLTELWAGRIESDRDANAVAGFLRPFVAVARDTGAALLLLHHTVKSGAEYRGSVQLGAGVDVVLTLRRPALAADAGEADFDEDVSDDGRRYLVGKGRASITVSLRLSFDGARYALGERAMPLRTRILRLVAETEPSASELIEKLGVRKQTVYDELRPMRNTVLLLVDGRYRLSPNGRRELEGLESVQTLASAARKAGTEAGTAPTERPHDAGRSGTALDGVRNEGGTVAPLGSAPAVPAPASYERNAGTDAIRDGTGYHVAVFGEAAEADAA